MGWWGEWTSRLGQLSSVELAVFHLLPWFELCLIYVWLRWIWPVARPPRSKDAPDLRDLLRGVERVFRKDDRVVAARSFDAGGAHVSEGARGIVFQRDPCTKAVRIAFRVQPDPDSDAVSVWVERPDFRYLEICDEDPITIRCPEETVLETDPLLSKYASGRVLEAGEVAGDYSLPWVETFDYTFLLIMAGLLAVLSAAAVFVPVAVDAPAFFVSQVPKVWVMMAVSSLGGLLARRYCDVDADGYVVTSAESWFKVNYTRKIQHFAAYVIPLVMGPADSGTPLQGTLATAWGDWFTLLAFLFMIKPVRERRDCLGKFSMLQFNSLDRPEDRPHTLDWIIAGNILPGLVCILVFDWLYSSVGFSKGLTMICVLVAGVGDGLAEPVGVYLGRHKYRVASVGSDVKYTRSLEGSACVYWSTLLFVMMYVHSFPNTLAFWLATAVMPPLMALAEAYAPHTLDTPVLMGLGGAALYCLTAASEIAISNIQ
eukprot:TRINITY_DN2335_c1_g2_i1.p1 TRINITY_DN2335_c1_g2~~TRINITY_DN2335_c1_g2_i1.p1  ORF type:complete len:485 (+),score=121.59 TRINITY_DN2335_c1_g2_i1:28-1482(+)